MTTLLIILKIAFWLAIASLALFGIAYLYYRYAIWWDLRHNGWGNEVDSDIELTKQHHDTD